jgi:hypothetical protein
MSLSPREELTLAAIEAELSRSAPGLATLLAIFTRLAASEDMSAREKIRSARGPGVRHPDVGRSRRAAGWPRRVSGHLRVSWQLAALPVWLAVTVGMITTAVTLSRYGANHAVCGSPPIASCPRR